MIVLFAHHKRVDVREITRRDEYCILPSNAINVPSAKVDNKNAGRTNAVPNG